jgi:purine nucleosidase
MRDFIASRGQLKATGRSLSRIIIDCDPGIDDAMALLLACASPELELLAVTTVAGNRPVETTTRNAGRILRAAGRDATQVFAGCKRPLAYPEARCNDMHGEDGLGGSALPPGRAPENRHAVDYIEGVLLDSEIDHVTLVAMGPLTNLALVEIKHPGLLRRAHSLLIMGGAAFRSGNVTPSAEFNFHADALAAQTVLASGANVLLFGLDVTSKASMNDAWIASFATLNTRCGRAAHSMLRAYAARDPAVHDACPVAYLVEPRLFSGAPCAVSVDWRPGPTEGHMCAWTSSHPRRPHSTNASVFTDVDAERLLALVHQRIACLP